MVWWTEGAQGINEGLTIYEQATGPIETEYDGIQARAKGRLPHSLDHADLVVVVQFKRWAGIRSYAGQKVLDGPPPDRLTAEAFQKALAGDVIGALRMLDQLPQVGIPTASAILAAVYPERFAVIDRYVMSEIGWLATNSLRSGLGSDHALSLLTESLTAWAVESWTAKAAGVSAYEQFIAGLNHKIRTMKETEGITFRPRDVEKAMYGHFLMRTGRRVA